MSPADLLAPERLLEHAPALRALARTILGDAHRAEDAVQETWRVALERPPRDGQGLGSWLRRVLVNVCRRELRGSSRRGERERNAARSEALEGQEAALARGQELQAVVAALLALGEPYRSTLIWRYVDELAPGDIARRSGVPLATVKTRLRRGLAQMREELGAERRSRAGALFAPPLHPSWAWILGGLIVKAKGTAAAAALVLLATGIWWLASEPLGKPVERAAAPPRGEAAAAEFAPLPLAGPARAPLTAEDSPAALRAAPPATHELALEVRVLDRDDRPLPARDIVLAAEGLETQHIGTSDQEGRLRVTLRSRAPSLEVWVGVRHSEWPREMLRVELSTQRPARATLIAVTPERLRLVAVRRGVDATISLSVAEGVADEIRVVFSAQDLRVPEAETAEDGSLILVDPSAAQLPGDEFPTGPGPGLRMRERVLSSVELQQTDEREEWVSAQTAILTGSLAGPAGEPAVGALVRLRAGGRRHDARTDAEGRYRFEGLPPGEAFVSAGGGPHGIARGTIALLPGQESDWSPQLERGIELTGRLRSPRDWSGWFLRAECPEGSFAKEVPLTADGSFALPNVPATPLRILAYPPQRATQLPALLAEAVWATSGALHLEASPEEVSYALLKAEVRDADGAAAPGALVRVEHRAGGRLLESGADGNAHCLVSLPPGGFELAVGQAATGWVELGPRALFSGEVHDLGPLELPRPGHLHLARGPRSEAAPGPARVAFELRRRSGPLDARVWRGELPLELPLELELAPGDYELRLDGTPHGLEIRPGARCSLTLD